LVAGFGLQVRAAGAALRWCRATIRVRQSYRRLSLDLTRCLAGSEEPSPAPGR